jgi:hypothetical protein
VANFFRALHIPADSDKPITELQLEVGSGTIAHSALMRFFCDSLGIPDLFPGYVRTPELDKLRPTEYDPDIHIVMVVDEEGHERRRPVNHRAWLFYPDPLYYIAGDVLMVAEDHSDPVEGWEVISLPDYVTPELVVERTQHTNIRKSNQR